MEARWHRSSENHIAGRATWDEIEEALQPPIVVDRTRVPSTLRVLGQTYSGRWLAVFVRPDDNAPTVYVITARDMDDTERRTYQRRKRKG